MAKTVKKINHLKIDYIKYKIAGVISFTITFAALVSFIIFPPLVSLLALVTSAILGNVFLKKSHILKIGWKGEEKSLKVYSKLSDSYIVMSDVYVTVDGETSQIDHIIIGDNGVFVVETKNINGIIEGNENSNKIIQYKIGRGGGSYTKEHYNPVKQVSTHVYRVSKLFKQHRINTWVQGIVYFVNDEAEVKLHSNAIPVFSASKGGKQEILTYITKYKNRTGTLSIIEKEKIQKCLLKR
ncbi:nuclease-related domain-containing protein [Clostridium oryzae]|uniref:Nuclease-related domain protein n=1 Tax=Clostridium oryzae TaxID=1450648 RepID=A0A1V4ILP2_9CLOT|nr:nuclease-related domain-containing protein [Clostridium oryzae]OPJ60948.1 nuclease-related domain protein [Clostridium oryzae]